MKLHEGRAYVLEWDACVCDMTHAHATWRIHTWCDAFTRDMTRLHITRLIYAAHDALSFDMTHQDLFKRDMTHVHVPWRIHIWREHVGHHVIKFVTFTVIKFVTFTWLTHMRVDIHIWRDAFTRDVNRLHASTSGCVMWLIQLFHDSFVCNMIHLYVVWRIHRWYESFTC